MGMVAFALQTAWMMTSSITDLGGAAFDVLQGCFLAFHTCELCLRGFALGLRCFRDYWVKFDLFVVLTYKFRILVSGFSFSDRILLLEEE